MANAGRYWRFIRIDAAGKPWSSEIPVAKAFFEQHLTSFDADLSDALIQRQLFYLIREISTSIDVKRAAECCLRCYISHIVEQACIDLEERFGRAHGFTRFDLFPFVLNDVDISESLLFPDNSPPAFQPLADKILQTFDPEQSSLSTWTRRLVERDKSLNDFLLENGVYLSSDWAILNGTSPGGVRRQLSSLLSEPELQQACLVLKSYHAIYRNDRIKQKLTGKKCTPPTNQQLQRMVEWLQENGTQNSTQQVMRQLQMLAYHLRQIQKRNVEPLDEQRADQQPASTTNDEEDDLLLSTYFREFLDCLDRAMVQVIDHRLSLCRRKQPPTDQMFLTALCLFYCQDQTMSAIAKVIGLEKQYQVTRLLALKQLREDVRRYTIEMMRDYARIHALMSDNLNLARLASLDRQLEQALDQIIAESEAEAMSSQRSSQSLFARRLCQSLNHRSI